MKYYPWIVDNNVESDFSQTSKIPIFSHTLKMGILDGLLSFQFLYKTVLYSRGYGNVITADIRKIHF